MTVLVLYGSWHVGTRILQHLSKLDGVIAVGGFCQFDETAKLIAEIRPEIVILDAQMREGEGIDLLRETKAVEPRPIVIMTAALPFEQYRRECMKEGSDFFFQLPLELGRLGETIQQLNEQRSSRTGLRRRTP